MSHNDVWHVKDEDVIGFSAMRAIPPPPISEEVLHGERHSLTHTVLVVDLDTLHHVPIASLKAATLLSRGNVLVIPEVVVDLLDSRDKKHRYTSLLNPVDEEILQNLKTALLKEKDRLCLHLQRITEYCQCTQCKAMSWSISNAPALIASCAAYFASGDGRKDGMEVVIATKSEAVRRAAEKHGLRADSFNTLIGV